MNTNKKNGLTLAGGVAVLALVTAACVDAAGPNESTVTSDKPVISTTTVTPSSNTFTPPEPEYVAPATAEVTTSGSTSDRAFMSTMEDFGVECGGPEQCLMTANVVCEWLDQGFTPDQLFAEMAADPYDQVLPNISNDDLPHLMGAATATHCPRHM